MDKKLRLPGGCATAKMDEETDTHYIGTCPYTNKRFQVKKYHVYCKSGVLIGKDDNFLACDWLE